MNLSLSVRAAIVSVAFLLLFLGAGISPRAAPGRPPT